jgi:hypothetical protein
MRIRNEEPLVGRSPALSWEKCRASTSRCRSGAELPGRCPGAEEYLTTRCSSPESGRNGPAGLPYLPLRLDGFCKFSKKIHVHPSGGPVPGAWSPRLRANVDAAIPIHVAYLQLVAADFLIEDDAFGKPASENEIVSRTRFSAWPACPDCADSHRAPVVRR